MGGKTNVEGRPHAWFALADAEHCRLLCCRLTEQARNMLTSMTRSRTRFPNVSPCGRRPGRNDT